MRTFYIAVKFCHRYDLSPSYIVTDLICHRSNCHRSGLSPIWPIDLYPYLRIKRLTFRRWNPLTWRQTGAKPVHLWNGAVVATV